MTSPSFRDIEQLSAYLDGQLPQSMRTRLEMRIHSDPAFAATLEELRQTRALLRRTPHRRAPRNFTLTPRMVGIRPPIPRLVPVFSWASAVAMLLFIFTLGTSLVGHLSVGTAAPIVAIAPSKLAGSPVAAATAAPATMMPVPAAPAAQPPVTNETLLVTPTAETFGMSVSEATPNAAGVVQSPNTPKALHRPPNLWLFIWSSLAVILGTLAILVLWLNKRAFQRNNPPG